MLDAKTNQELNVEMIKKVAIAAVSEVLREFGVKPTTTMMSTQEVADYWGVSMNKVLLAVDTGELRAIKVSSRLFRYKPEDVEVCEALWASKNYLAKP